MYFYYHSLAKLFRENLVSKAGDEANCRHIHINLMYYTHPSRLRKINGCALIYHELRRSVLKRMTPNYSQFVQRLINSRVPAGLVPRAGRITMEQLTLSLRGNYTEVPSMIPQEGRTKAAHDTPGASSSRSHRRSGFKAGAAKFMTSLWDMCRSSYDVNHKALQLAQGTRQRQNDFLASKGMPVPDSGPEMDPVPYIHYEMPPVCDEMFQGYDFRQMGPPRHGRTAPPADDADDDAANEDDDDQFFG